MNSYENIEDLWNQLSSGLKSFILSKVNNVADAEDILQDVYLKMHGNLHGMKDKSKVIPWVYQVTRNQVVDHFRAVNRNQKIFEIKETPALSSGSGKIMAVAISDMLKMMNGMPPEYCEALCLIEIEGMTQKQYAEEKGLSYSGAKSRVQRARIMLKDMLLRCCHYQFDKYGTVFDIQPKCCCCCGT